MSLLDSAVTAAPGPVPEAEPLPANAAPGVHAAVLALLSKLPPGRLLDAPAGTGAVSAAAHRLGFQVTACDICPEVFAAADLTCQRVDLQHALPYGDHSFDAIVCVEGLEHVENPHHLLREFHRLLRRDGHLIVTTPNVLSLQERVRMLLAGITYYFDFDRMLTSVGHINPVSILELRMALGRAGFSITGVTTNRTTRAARPLSLLAPLVRLCTRRLVKDEAMRSLLTAPAVLFGEILVVTARAEGAAAASSGAP